MASKAIEFRLSEVERQLAQLRDHAQNFQADAARLQEKIDAIRRSLTTEAASAASPSSTAEPVRRPVTPPPLPPQRGPKPATETQPHLPTPPAAATSPTTETAQTSATPASTPVPAHYAKCADAPAAPRREGLELELGRVWFVRLGIGLLLTGFVFLSTYAYQNYIVHMGAGIRVLALYAAAVALTAGGLLIERWKDSLRNYGRVVTAGGWAAIYYTTYAAHHVEHLRVIASPVMAAMLLTFAALAFFAYAAARKSSILTTAALALAFYATAINPMGWLGCFSGFLLSAIGMVFFLRFRWLQTGIAILCGAYLSYAYWQGLVNADAGADPTRWFLVAYWILFTAGLFAPQVRQHKRDFLVGFASANNLLFFVLFSFRFATGTWVDHLWLNAVVFGAVLLGIAIFLGRRREFPALLADVFLAKGLAFLTWGLALELSGHHLFLTLTLEALVLAFVWRRTRSPILRAFVWISAAIAAATSLAVLSPANDPAPLLAYLLEGLLFIPLGVLMRGDPWIDEPGKTFSFEATAAAFLALAIPTAALHMQIDPPELGLWMMGTGLVIWIAFLSLAKRWPLPELAWLGQGFAAFGALLALVGAQSTPQLVLLAAFTAIAFQAHGLASDGRFATPHRHVSRLFEAIFTGLFLLAVTVWIHRDVSDSSQRLLLFTLLPFAGHLCGSFLARLPIAAMSQLFYLATFVLSVWSWTRDGTPSAPSQGVALAALGLVLVHLAAIHLMSRLSLRDLFRETHLALAAVLWAGWCAAFVTPWWLVFAWTGCALAFLPARFRSSLLQPAALTFLAIGLAGLCLLEDGRFWLRYLALPAPFLVHLVQSRRLDPDRPAAALWSLLATGVAVAFTVIVSQHTLEAFDGKGLAICWALLGLALFGLGLAVKVRVYRLGGLALLGLSLSHVLLVDVWELETVLRILSFLTLGLVLLALGFVYNRWNEAIRRVL